MRGHITNFNPRSRKGFDRVGKVHLINFCISIHEAAKASTKMQAFLKICVSISIHEAAKASTVTAVVAFPSCSYFNPRSRKGFDR